MEDARFYRIVILSGIMWLVLVFVMIFALNFAGKYQPTQIFDYIIEIFSALIVVFILLLLFLCKEFFVFS